MKSLDSVIESFRIVLKNPKMMLVYFAYLLFILFLIVFAVIFSIGVIPISSITSYKTLLEYLESTSFLLIIAIIAFFVIIVLFVSPIFTGMLLSMGIQAVKGKVSIEKAFNEAKKKYFSLLGVSLVNSTIFAFVGVLFLLLLFSLRGFSALFSLFILVIGAVLIVAVFVILGILFYEANTLVFTENKKAIEAIKRSIYIGNKKALSIFAIIFFFGVINMGIGFVVAILHLPISILGSLLLDLLFYIFIELPVNCFTSTVGNILPVVFYYNYNLKKI